MVVHGYDRSEEQKAAIAFVGFDDKIIATAKTRRGSCLIDSAADDKSGIEMRCGKYRCDKRSGGGFAVRSANRNAVFQAHQFGQHLGARNYGNLTFMGFGNFGIARRNG